MENHGVVTKLNRKLTDFKTIVFHKKFISLIYEFIVDERLARVVDKEVRKQYASCLFLIHAFTHLQCSVL
jgi:hypothetical protein